MNPSRRNPNSKRTSNRDAGETIRLSRFISLVGMGSRRSAALLIGEGRIEVNGCVVREVATRVDPHRDVIEIDGVRVRPPRMHTYMILNKPPGFVCSTLSSKRHRSIYSLLPGGGSPTLKYAGRLDADSEGLVLLTDDGELIFRLTHPRYKLRKIYLVKTSRIPDRKSMQRLESGIELSDGMTRPCRARLEAQGGGGAVVRVELFEGRNRQLRRMFDAVGFRVTGLKRIGIGSLRLGSLMQGKTRKLTGIEIERLKKSVGLPGSR